jgi:hypothetical protein
MISSKCKIYTIGCTCSVVNALNLTWHDGLLSRTNSIFDLALQRTLHERLSVEQEDHTRYRIPLLDPLCYLCVIKELIACKTPRS